MKFQKFSLVEMSQDLIGEEHLNKLQDLSENRVEIIEKGTSREEIFEKIKDCDALIIRFSTVVDKEMIDNCPNLKFIGEFATSFSKIDVKYAREKNISVANLGGYSTEAVAEFAFATLLTYLRELKRARNNAKKGEFGFTQFLGGELKGKTFGIVGLGNIGKRTAEIAKGIGMNVIYWSRNRKQEYEDKGIQYIELDQVYKDSDFVSINLALNDETKNFVNEQAVNSIKQNGIIINLSPTELIDINTVEKRLENKEITYICDHGDENTELAMRLQKHKNYIAYPPIGFRTKEAVQRQRDITVNNVKGFLEGNPQNVVN